MNFTFHIHMKMCNIWIIFLLLWNIPDAWSPSVRFISLFIFKQILSPKSPKSQIQEKVSFFLIRVHIATLHSIYILICELCKLWVVWVCCSISCSVFPISNRELWNRHEYFHLNCVYVFCIVSRFMNEVISFWMKIHRLADGICWVKRRIGRRDGHTNNNKAKWEIRSAAPYCSKWMEKECIVRLSPNIITYISSMCDQHALVHFSKFCIWKNITFWHLFFDFGEQKAHIFLLIVCMHTNK